MPRKYIPSRTPLTSVEYIDVAKGRRILVARYPSATSGDIWSTTIADDGHAIACDCPSGRNQHPCWHTHDAPAAVIAYHTALWFVRSPTERDNWERHLRAYLDMPLDESDRSAALLELQAVCQVGKQRREVAA
jgi:hypothetical protein